MNLGNVYLNQGRLQERQELLERALVITRQARNPDEVQAARILSNLGSLEYFRGHDMAAAELWREALGVFEDAGAEAHPEPVVALLSNLARAEIALGQLGDAESGLLRARSLIESANEPNLPALAQVEAGLAKIDELRDQYDAADEHLERCLEIRERVLGPEHPLVGLVLSELGDLKRRNGAADDARQLIERSLTIHERAFGPDSPRTAEVLVKLARVDRIQGQLSSAEARLDGVLAVLETDQPGPTLATALTELALVRQESGAIEQGQTLLERALEIYETGSGTKPEVAETAEHLADIYQRLGETGLARGALKRALEARRQLLGDDHARVTDLERRLAELSDEG
jgi:tetratricopeptide (TPR) repeat protein